MAAAVSATMSTTVAAMFVTTDERVADKYPVAAEARCGNHHRLQVEVAPSDDELALDGLTASVSER